ncbi:MAG TPA: hypothetical protein DCP85_13785 [Elusimicrobia bacterium]|nr:hypothetical protein [Elusimicrobiota bacterium]
MKRLRLAAIVLLCLCVAPRARASVVVWDGGGNDDSWFNPLNWAPDGVPGVFDDVTIDMSTRVAAPAGISAVNINSLTLGDAGGQFAPTLIVSTGLSAAGAGVVSSLHSSSTLVLDTLSQAVFTGLVLAHGSSMTHTAATGAFVNLRVMDALDIQAGATITARGAGYGSNSGVAPGLSAANGGGGGGHGAAGGSGAFGGAGGGAYDSLKTPGEYGSGGGLGSFSDAGGAGGGLIVINAGTVTVSGLITAAGTAGADGATAGGGGGAGGSIRIRTGYLYGQGALSVAGGAGGGSTFSGGGGGGGGRISVVVTGPYDVLTSTLAFQTAGGMGGTAPNDGMAGGSGSLHVDPVHWTGGAAGSNIASQAANWYGAAPVAGNTVVFGASNTVKDCSWDLGISVAVGSFSIIPGYAGTITLDNTLQVTGTWDMSAGTVTMTGDYALRIDSHVAQTGGRFDLRNGTFTLQGLGTRNVSFTSDSLFQNFFASCPAAGIGVINLLSDLDVDQNLIIGPNCTMNLPAGKTLRLAGNWPWVGQGNISIPPSHLIVADGSRNQVWEAPPSALGRVRVSKAGGTLTWNSGAAGVWTLGGAAAASELTVDAGSVFSAAKQRINISGDWVNYGDVSLSGSTVAFISTAVDQSIAAGGNFSILEVANPGRVLFVSTPTVVASSVSVAAGTLDLGVTTMSVGSHFLQSPGAVVRAAAGTIIFNGNGPGAQRVALQAGSSFYHVISSGTSVVIASPLVVVNDLEWHRGTLQISSQPITALGNLLRKGGGSLVVGGSTITFSGTSPQAMEFGSAYSLNVDNSHPAGVRLLADLLVKNRFSVQPGRTFDAQDHAFTMTGSTWSTAGANYLSVNPAHAVTWTPASGTMYVAAGSTINANVVLSANRTAYLQGDLNLCGFGNVLDPRSGAVIINAAGGSTITFRDTADLAPSMGSNWIYGGDAANSWLVYEGTGTARGSLISSNALGNLLVRLAGDTSTFLHSDMNLAGSLAVQSGVFRPAGDKTLSLQRDFIQTGGVVDYVSVGTGTLRFQGTGTAQAVSLLAGHSLQGFVLDASTTVLARSALNVRGDFTVLRGTFSAGAYAHRLGGNLDLAAGTWFEAQGSTLTLDGSWNVPPVTKQSLTHPAGVGFHGLVVDASSVVFNQSFRADVFTDRVAGSTLVFASAGPGFVIDDLRLAGGAPPAGRIMLRPQTPGVAWKLTLVAASSVTAVDASSCNASGGLVVHANDGKTRDAGGNLNWNFKPSLRVVPGGPQQAGVPFGVAVEAVDSSGNFVPGGSFSVGLTWSELYVSTPAPLSLVNGATVFSNVILRTAQTTSISPQPAEQAFSVIGDNVVVLPGAFKRLQVLMPGESPVPGSPAGKTGFVDVLAAGNPFAVRVAGTDLFWNQNPAAADQVELSTLTSLASNLPQRATLSAGLANFPSVIFTASATVISLTATDLSDPLILPDTGTAFNVFSANSSSPSVSINIPAYSSVLTLSGALSGTASDMVAVAQVRVAIQRKDNGLYFAWSAPAFASAAPLFSTAAVDHYLGRIVQWNIPFADAGLTDRTSYYVLAVATNPSGNLSVAETTFTFSTSSLLNPSPGDGGGLAVVATSSTLTSGCQLLAATVTFTAGPLGISPGGAVAVHLPEGWTKPTGLSAINPPATSGLLHVGATTAFTVEFNPPEKSGVVLGENWIVLNPVAAVTPGQRIFFTFYGLPPPGPAGGGALDFLLMTQGNARGALKPIGSSPQLSLPAGPPARLAFYPDTPLALGPLQPSATMELRLTDLCGGSTVAAEAITVSLWAGQADAPDEDAVFYQTGGARLGAQQVVIPVKKSSAAPQFYYRTSTAGVSYELILATAVVPGVGLVTATRFVRLSTTAVGLWGVSVDTGVPTPGALIATMTGNSFAGQAFINFELSDPNLRWEVTISTSPGTFYPPLFRRSGQGSPGRALAWSGADENFSPSRFVEPGVYYVRVALEDGSVRNESLRIAIAPSASIYGSVGSSAAYASVRVTGPNSSYGNYAVASSSGFFRICGLRSGAIYNLEASTAVLWGGQPLDLTVSSRGIAASESGVDAGTMTFPAPSLLRVSVVLPDTLPRDLWGRVFLHDDAYARTAFGSLHFSSSTSTSDDGGGSFGGGASSWTAIGVPPGTYDVDVEVYGLGLSTRVAGRVLAPGARTDLPLTLARKASVLGSVILPSTTTFDAWIAVEARLQGSSVAASLSGALVPCAACGPQLNRTSAAYALYGLDPGTWSVTARGPGLIAASTSVFIAGSAALGGIDLALGSGGVIRGTVTVTGDTGRLRDDQPDGFSVYVQAFNPATLARAAARVRLSTSSAVASSTFAIAGLEDGNYLVTAQLEGFIEARREVSVAAGVGLADMNLRGGDARLFWSVKLPGGGHSPADFRKVSLFRRGPEPGAVLQFDMTAGTTVQYFPSSATLQSPPLAPGYYICDALYGPTGMFASAGASLTQGATALVTLDLSGSTVSLSGKVALAGNIVYSSASYAVNVTSVPGVLSFSPTTSYCLMGSAVPVTLSAFHMELLPVRSLEGAAPVLTEPLMPASPSGCSSATFSLSAQGAPNRAHAYAAAIGQDGSFVFPNVPAGFYLLRNGADLDNNRANGDELPQTSRLLSVSSAPAPVFMRIEPGVTVSGDVILPPQASSSRAFAVTLRDGQGTPLRAATVNLSGAHQAPYRFDKVPNGAYVLTVQDLGQPALYSASPRAVTVSGLSMSGQDLRLFLTGVIRGRIAVEELRPDGARGYTVVSRSNVSILPRNLRIEAAAEPWFPGGFVAARSAACEPEPCAQVQLDDDDQFVIEGVLPGSYQVRFLARNAGADSSQGGAGLVSASVPGVAVAGGRVTDVGIVSLASAADLRGLVLDASTGLGVANVAVEARPSLRQGANSEVLRCRTDGDGVFVLSGLDLRTRFYDLTAAGRGERSGPTDALPPYETGALSAVDLSSAPAPVLRLRPAPYSIRGRIAAPPGGPALALPFGDAGEWTPGALLLLQKRGHIPVEDPLSDIRAQTDADGNFIMPALTTGTYKLTVAAQGYGSLTRVVTIVNASVNLGSFGLTQGARLSGSLRKPDGSMPSADEVSAVAAATADLGEVFFADLETDDVTRGIARYSLTGLRPGVPYQILLVGAEETNRPADEAREVVLSSASESRTLDLIFRAARPWVLARARRGGSGFRLTFEFSQPLRRRTAADDDLARVVSTFSALGGLSELELAVDRRRLTAFYAPPAGVSESSFTLRLRGYTAVVDPDSFDPVDPEFLIASTVAFYSGIDRFSRVEIPNFSGGNLMVEGDAGRVTLPGGAFRIAPSSAVEVTLQVSAEPLAQVAGQMIGPGAGSRAESIARNLSAMRYAPASYPGGILRAVAATPPDVSPWSAFYDVALPAGAVLAKPAQLTVSYSTGVEPSRLNLYWYNAAANAYILQQDVTGAAPVIDRVNRTITINVNHFSTYVLFESGVAVISGNAFAGGDVEVFNFPNPFDLAFKTVTALHPAANLAVRGTMIRIGLPLDVAGQASVRIYNVAGERVKTLELGSLDGGAYYYQPWDGRTESGRDAASGVYVGVLKVGGRTKSFKMALIK